MRATLTIMAMLWAGTAIAVPMNCADLTPEALGTSDVTFTEVAVVPAGEDSPVAQCRIRATTAERTGSDGRPYALRFELALPDDWNGDFVHQFNGGNDGEVKPATGALGAGTGDQSPLARGFAVVSSDAGHDGAANPDMGLAGGAAFGADFEARQMYGYKAVEILQPLARQMVDAYYGTPVERAYGIGCSNGGRHAMVAAARMPDAFDGLLIGAPGFNLPRAAVQHALDVQTFQPLTGDIRTSFSTEDLHLVADSMRASCDGLDGLKDGLIGDTAACQAAFDVTALQCTGGQNSDCLSAAQVQALQTIHAGPKGADGQQLYSDWAWDAGIEGGNWRFWKVESTVPPWDQMPIIAVMGAASLAQIFTVPPTEVGGSPQELMQFLLEFDIAGQAEMIDASSDALPESPMEVMSPPDSDDPALAEFRAAGGRMIITHGVSDPVFSVNDTARWYASLDKNNDGQAADFARFYPVPGMNHCSGGPATDAFDLLTPLIAWVEDGTAPEAVTASARADNDEVPEGLQGATRPLCPAPQVARYQEGDPKSADSFQCQ
ncbi:tannase/feruloyl esterase family alpha/beta hydrolase [Paracoccus tegillarcae]|uniref:Tannase/feruloyl esterase family alpha/beta hydrolase n=1 Tax=Paracoccus tegillarcae TaxID=1529068 RepID=A0A2K9EH61_9RHOB|nr:tannase/feruloyl esterase family alpha/beta hydrolase [Paracoccus tegillarcae]AUH32657.1 tannase/feruloyl esterase family alpha/beta hydrolase [Paracoccus tegillarcae]